MEFKRCSGILMPISSLPGGYGIGSMGKPAHDFVDFLAKAGQTIWQILPVGPTGYADSPYQSCSAFAGNATEFTAYANATRPQWVEANATSQTISNAASQAEFVFSAGGPYNLYDIIGFRVVRP